MLVLLLFSLLAIIFHFTIIIIPNHFLFLTINITIIIIIYVWCTCFFLYVFISSTCVYLCYCHYIYIMLLFFFSWLVSCYHYYNFCMSFSLSLWVLCIVIILVITCFINSPSTVNQPHHFFTSTIIRVELSWNKWCLFSVFMMTDSFCDYEHQFNWAMKKTLVGLAI